MAGCLEAGVGHWAVCLHLIRQLHSCVFVFVSLYFCICICVFVFVCLYLCVCICVFVFVNLYLWICICGQWAVSRNLIRQLQSLPPEEVTSPELAQSLPFPLTPQWGLIIIYIYIIYIYHLSVDSNIIIEDELGHPSNPSNLSPFPLNHPHHCVDFNTANTIKLPYYYWDVYPDTPLEMNWINASSRDVLGCTMYIPPILRFLSALLLAVVKYNTEYRHYHPTHHN